MDAVQRHVHVWLETVREAGHLVVVPYAQSMRDSLLGFRLNADCKGAGGVSRISQQGQLSLSAGRAARLAQLSFGSAEQMQFGIEITVRSDGQDAGVYRFDFPAR
ncbi:MAG TPA: curli-like amyloid fiber formation chaperone CsgH [Noviherbaspirillum sp.]|uniref:curli-like amyloid fiber formation chaperone CsgH n=1 Tax=Noviherbaspirillum sp. TaxID=1926288 RepID=UPI002F95BF09